MKTTTFGFGITATESLGGPIANHPVAVATGGERIDIFSRSPTGDLQWKYFDAGWYPSTLGWDTTSLAALTPIGPIAAVRGATAGTIHLFVTDVDGLTYYCFYNGSFWGLVTSLGGFGYGRIAAVLNGSAVDVVVRGGDGGLYRKQVTSPYFFSPSSGCFGCTAAL